MSCIPDSGGYRCAPTTVPSWLISTGLKLRRDRWQRARTRERSAITSISTRKLPPRPRLAFRAVERRPVHELLPAHHRAAAPAVLSFAAIGVQRPVEVAGLAVDVDVERIERRPAVGQRV